MATTTPICCGFISGLVPLGYAPSQDVACALESSAMSWGGKLLKHMRDSWRYFYVVAWLAIAGQASAGSVFVVANDDAIVLSTNALEAEHVQELKDPTDSFEHGEPASKLLARQDMTALPFHHEVVEAAMKTALDPALIHAVIKVESNHNPRAISHKGAYGLMQLMPDTAKRFGLGKLKQSSQRQHVLAGAQYLKALLDLFNGNLELALAAYNAGPGSVQKHHNRIPPYQETRHYVPKVLKQYRLYAG